jgi:hypothetical protein
MKLKSNSLQERYFDYTVPRHCSGDARRHVSRALLDLGVKNAHFDVDKGWLSVDVFVSFDATRKQWNSFCNWSDRWAQVNGMFRR